MNAIDVNRLNAWVSEILNAYIALQIFQLWLDLHPPVATAQDKFSNEILCYNFGTKVFVYYR